MGFFRFCLSVCLKKIHFFLNSLLGEGGGEHGQILSHWDRLPQELRQSIQWMADRKQVHDRLQRGWDKIHAQGFKDICQFCQVRMRPRDDPGKWCLDLPQRHCQQCNVCFDCLIYYDSDASMRGNECTWYEAHFHNGLRISVLDEDLSQAQLAQLEEFLEVEVDYLLS